MNKWLKIILVISTFIAISILTYLILKFFGLANISLLTNLISSGRISSYIIYVIVLSLILTLLCFLPLLNTSLIIASIAIFGSKIAFITNIVAVFISSTLLFFIGDKFGERFAAKLIGKKNLDDIQNRIDHTSRFLLPILFITPGIPDEGICLIAGMTKIKYWYLILVSVIYHAIEIGLFCFLGNLTIPWKSLSALDWIIIINLLTIDIYLFFKLEKYFKNKK